MKRDEGLHAAEVPKKEDAGRGEKGDEDGNQGEDERTNSATPKTCSVKDTTMKEEAVEGREFRHVPGGTWLHRVHLTIQGITLTRAIEKAARGIIGGLWGDSAAIQSKRPALQKCLDTMAGFDIGVRAIKGSGDWLRPH
ncbi:hypothetical protein NDU88_006390 [Pleurodeles waltl]|uniref:Uncharacterized protein n=1 Tax=Pleurodeles waltl TaxID=8319 RepID=A0AAV7X0J5_PLEWA|nr:hypothetical protein NDU88_006390 [Pleurodeles waltl]